MKRRLYRTAQLLASLLAILTSIPSLADQVKVGLNCVPYNADGIPVVRIGLPDGSSCYMIVDAGTTTVEEEARRIKIAHCITAAISQPGLLAPTTKLKWIRSQTSLP